MDSRKMQAIGICRFSYPAIGGFQVDHASVQEREAFLYDDKRMAQRFRYFESFTLPSIRAQTDPDFTFLVVIGETLPAHWRERLMDGLATFPQAVVQAHPPGTHRDVMKDAINSVRQDRGSPALQFRMDDDDAVCLGFVETLRNTAQDCAGLISRHRHIAIDFCKGYVARPGPEGIDAQQVVETLWTPGLAMTSAANSRTTILNFSHTRMGRFMPVVSLPEGDMFVRGHSDLNDSRQGPHTKEVALERLDSDGETYFKTVFGIDGNAVRTAFSAT